MRIQNINYQMKKTAEEKCQTQLIHDTHLYKIFSNSILTTFLFSKQHRLLNKPTRYNIIETKINKILVKYLIKCKRKRFQTELTSISQMAQSTNTNHSFSCSFQTFPIGVTFITSMIIFIVIKKTFNTQIIFIALGNTTDDQIDYHWENNIQSEKRWKTLIWSNQWLNMLTLILSINWKIGNELVSIQFNSEKRNLLFIISMHSKQNYLRICLFCMEIFHLSCKSWINIFIHQTKF